MCVKRIPVMIIIIIKTKMMIIIMIITLLAIKFKGVCLVNCNAGARNDVRLNLSSGPRFAKHFGVAFLGGKPFGACRGMDFQLRAAAYIRENLLC